MVPIMIESDLPWSNLLPQGIMDKDVGGRKKVDFAIDFGFE